MTKSWSSFGKILAVVVSVLAVVGVVVGVTNYLSGIEKDIDSLEDWKIQHDSNGKLSQEQAQQLVALLSVWAQDGTSPLGVIDKEVREGKQEINELLNSSRDSIEELHSQITSDIERAQSETLQVAKDLADSIIPVGSIIAWPGALPQDPDWNRRWKVCNGETVECSDELWPLLAPYQARGILSKPEFVKLPDFQCYFLRGMDPSRTVDQEMRSFGAAQVDALAAHDHSTEILVWSSDGHQFQPIDGSTPTSKALPTRTTRQAFDTETKALGSNETRPENSVVHWLIKVSD